MNKEEILKKILIKNRGYKEQSDKIGKIQEKSMLRKIERMLENASSDKKIYEDSPIINEIEENSGEFCLEDLKNNLANYITPEFAIYILKCAHNDLNSELTEMFKKDVKSATRFVPFELRNWNEVKEEFNVLKPIMDAMKIDVTTEQVKDEFKRMKIVYFINNRIFSKHDIKERIEDIERNYAFMTLKDKKTKSEMAEVVSSEKYMDEIIAHVTNNQELDIKELLKDSIKLDIQKNQIGICMLETTDDMKHLYKYSDKLSQKKIALKRNAISGINSIIPKTLFEIFTFNNGAIMKNLNKYEYNYFDFSEFSGKKSRFINVDDLTDEQQKFINKREKKVNNFVKKVKESKSKKYDIPGVITFVILGKEERYINSKNIKNKKEKIIQIEITKRELANIGLLPEEIGWETKKKALLQPNELETLVEQEETSKNVKENLFEKFKFPPNSSYHSEKTNLKENIDNKEDYNR